MAISRDKKRSLVSEFSEALASSKMTVAASYAGVSVAELQELRRTARESGVTIKVIKNRLVRVALEQSDTFKKADTSLLQGPLLYALSAVDEVAPAQVIAAFAKKHPQMELIAGFDASGASLDTAAVKVLADLPTKDQLRGMVVSTIAAPLTQMLGVLNGAQRGFAQVLSQHSEKISA
ncbi:50S ribosomal protein L10 [Pedobacter sp.]|nr:50S ribosomal protein L10 [Candidatus Saccharibacteria bacterium]